MSDDLVTINRQQTPIPVMAASDPLAREVQAATDRLRARAAALRRQADELDAAADRQQPVPVALVLPPGPVGGGR